MTARSWSTTLKPRTTDLRRGPRQKPRPLWQLIVGHILALGVALVLYALPHHVIPHRSTAIGVFSSRHSAEAAHGIPATAAPTLAAGEAPPPTAVAADPSPTPEPEEAIGDFRRRFEGHFTNGDVQRTETTYRSANLDISITSGFSELLNARAYVADIYIADISCLQTAFAQDTFGRGYTEWLPDIAARMESIVSINGDYYGTRDAGVVIRNGELYRNNKLTQDVAVLYWSGEFETFSPGAFDAMAEMERGAYQSWCFGPMLLDEDGRAMQGFNANYSLLKRHPRSAIGYYEPGHYCFVAVDGRNDESRGATIHQLSDFMASLGVRRAYNLDGGQTSLLCAGATLINQPSDGGRNTSDAILILDRVTEEMNDGYA